MTSPLPAVWAALGGASEDIDRLTVTGPDRALTSTFDVTGAGVAAVGASLLAATARPVALDTRGLAVALRSERYLLRDGRSAGAPFDPLSAFHRTADGWLRLHANYPWHRAAALQVLGCAEKEVPDAIAGRAGVELETALRRAGWVPRSAQPPGGGPRPGSRPRWWSTGPSATPHRERQAGRGCWT